MRDFNLFDANSYRFLLLLLFPLATTCASACTSTATRTLIQIPTINYHHLLNFSGPFGLPRLNVSLVNYSDVVNVSHDAVVLENEFLRVTLLPAMGRVYSIEDKTTGHDVIWKNRIAAPAGANNDLGWWLWIGGIEYTLPGQEHGFTWALDWDWSIDQSTCSNRSRTSRNTTSAAEHAATVVTTVMEPTTGIVETLTFSLAQKSMSLDTRIHLYNPSQTNSSMFAHWTNVPFVPGGRNRLPDSSEFIIPTDSISVEPRWQSNLGPGWQDWSASPLRYFRNWTNGTRMGDFTANNLKVWGTVAGTSAASSSFFGTYSHYDDEGGIRIFDARATPGLDTWTYGFEPTVPCFPQNKKISRCSYAEMWGGTVKQLEELKPLLPRANLTWIEHVVPFHGILGLTFANQFLAANTFYRDGCNSSSVVVVALFPIRSLPDVEVVLGNRSRHIELFRPGNVVQAEFSSERSLNEEGAPVAAAVVRVLSAGAVVASFPIPCIDSR